MIQHSTVAAFFDDHGLQVIGLLFVWATLLLVTAWIIGPEPTVMAARPDGVLHVEAPSGLQTPSVIVPPLTNCEAMSGSV